MSRVKTLVVERDGSELEFQEEVNPSSDYIAAKGLAFENLATHLSEKVGGVLKFTVPDCSYKYDYTVAGEVNFVEVYEGATQTTINRRLRVDMTYDGNLNPTIEAWKFYDPADGTSILRTITITHTWSGVDLIKSTEVTT